MIDHIFREVPNSTDVDIIDVYVFSQHYARHLHGTLVRTTPYAAKSLSSDHALRLSLFFRALH